MSNAHIITNVTSEAPGSLYLHRAYGNTQRLNLAEIQSVPLPRLLPYLPKEFQDKLVQLRAERLHNETWQHFSQRAAHMRDYILWGHVPTSHTAR